MRKTLIGVITLILLGVAVPAFAKDHNNPPPPAPAEVPMDAHTASVIENYFDDPKNSVTTDYMIMTDGGYDDQGNLLANPPLTYVQRIAIWNTDKRCRDDLKAGLLGVDAVKAKVGFKTFFLETLGAVLGTIAGNPSTPARYLGEVAGQVGGAALGGGLAGGDEEVRELLSAAVSYCMLQRIGRHRSLFYDVFIDPTIRFKARGPKTLAPGEAAPDTDNASRSNAADATAAKLTPPGTAPVHF